MSLLYLNDVPPNKHNVHDIAELRLELVLNTNQSHNVTLFLLKFFSFRNNFEGYNT